MTATQERSARKRVNESLYRLGLTYWECIPLSCIDNILTEEGFRETEPAIYCGREGTSHERVGDHTWFTMTWHKMESGKYEVTAYVS